MLTADQTPPSDRFAEKPSNLVAPFRRGQPGGPGRPKGSRNKLSEKFFTDIYGLWGEQGEAVLRRAAFEKPMEFAAMVAKLMPAKLEIDVGPTDGISLERMEQLIALAERMASLRNGAPASVTIEGHALEVEGGGGSPHDALTRGEVIEVVHTSSASPNISPDFSAAPHATPSSSQASMPDAGPAYSTGPDEEDDIDPMSLF